MRSRLRGQAGQSTAMVLSMLFVFVVLAGVVVDVGQAVNRRIALQVAADTGAFTGASAMAAGMNNLATLNGWIQYGWEGLAYANVGFTVTECDVAHWSIDLYKAFRTVMGVWYQLVNIGVAMGAYVDAQDVTQSNMRDLLPGEQCNRCGATSDLSADAHVFSKGFWLVDPFSQVDDGSPTHVWGSSFMTHANKNPTWVCVKMCGPIPCGEVLSENFDVWYKKDQDDLRYFSWIVTMPRKRAVMFDSLFGGYIIPEMKAVAVAKPVGGSIENADGSYVAKMIPAAYAMGAQWLPPSATAVIYDSSAPWGFRYVTH